MLSTQRRIQVLQKKKKRGRLWCNGEQGLSCLGLDFTVMKMFECCWSVTLPLLTASPTFEHDEITLLEQAVWTASQWDAAAGKITEKRLFRVIHGLNQVCVLKDVISLTHVASYCFVKRMCARRDAFLGLRFVVSIKEICEFKSSYVCNLVYDNLPIGDVDIHICPYICSI